MSFRMVKIRTGTAAREGDSTGRESEAVSSLSHEVQPTDHRLTTRNFTPFGTVHRKQKQHDTMADVYARHGIKRHMRLGSSVTLFRYGQNSEFLS